MCILPIQPPSLHLKVWNVIFHGNVEIEMEFGKENIHEKANVDENLAKTTHRSGGAEFRFSMLLSLLVMVRHWM